MAKLPFNLSKAVNTWKEVSANTSLSANVVLAGDQRLVALAQQRFSSGGTLPATWVRPVAELTEVASVPGELLVVFVTPEGEAEALAALAGAAPKGGAVVAVDEGNAATGKAGRTGLRSSRLSFADTPAGWDRLFGVCAEVAGDHVAALGRRYPAIREAAARRVMVRTAGQNGLVGLAFFVPGADMPAMTLNQAKMVLSIAGIYGEEINQERVVELVSVVGLGFALRGVARYLVRKMPGIGWVVKGVAGYAATLAMGKATVFYFERGAPASTGRVVALAGSLRR
ncbi:MAG: DUF697 domain-containing protein [Thermoleophilia bacterium]|nr:DUF697 domain-containing protein [Thermoleophilia bacterium]